MTTVDDQISSNISTGIELGGYVIEEKIGEGGMGTVYRAKHLALGRDIALKVLSETFCRDEEAVNNFFKEARSVANLRHRNIIQAYDVGTTDCGRHYFAMELVEGQNLNDIIYKFDKVPEDYTISIAVEMAEGFKHAWETNGLSHGDIKPENIMYTYSKEVKITDFGLARSVHDESDEDIMLTPAYAAPELISRVTTRISPATDIYSFGISLYHMLAGHPPFEGEDYQEVYRKHLDEEAPSLVTFGVSRSLSDFVDILIDKDPEERLDDWSELIDELTWLAEQPETRPLKDILSKVAIFALIPAIIMAAIWFGMSSNLNTVDTRKNAASIQSETIPYDLGEQFSHNPSDSVDDDIWDDGYINDKKVATAPSLNNLSSAHFLINGKNVPVISSVAKVVNPDKDIADLLNAPTSDQDEIQLAPESIVDEIDHVVVDTPTEPRTVDGFVEHAGEEDIVIDVIEEPNEEQDVEATVLSQFIQTKDEFDKLVTEVALTNTYFYKLNKVFKESSPGKRTSLLKTFAHEYAKANDLPILLNQKMTFLTSQLDQATSSYKILQSYRRSLLNTKLKKPPLEGFRVSEVTGRALKLRKPAVTKSRDGSAVKSGVIGKTVKFSKMNDTTILELLVAIALRSPSLDDLTRDFVLTRLFISGESQDFRAVLRDGEEDDISIWRSIFTDKLHSPSVVENIDEWEQILDLISEGYHVAAVRKLRIFQDEISGSDFANRHKAVFDSLYRLAKINGMRAER